MRAACVVLALLGVAAAHADDPVVWENGPYHPDLVVIVPSIYWDFGDGLDTALADDFQLTEDTNVTRVRWTGGAFGELSAPAPSFLIEFFPSAANGLSPLNNPGDASAAALATYLIDAADVEVIPDKAWPGLNINFAVDLPVPFEAVGGVHYWISIQGYYDDPSNLQSYGWVESATQHMSKAAMTSDGTWHTLNQNTDLTFTLFGAAPVCMGDVVSNESFLPPGDGTVDGADLAYLLNEWGRNPGSPADFVTSRTFLPPADGVVDGADLAALLVAWGACE